VGTSFLGLKIRAEEIYRPSEKKKKHMKIDAECIQYVRVLYKFTLQTYLRPHDAGSPRMPENLCQSTRRHFPGDLSALRMIYWRRAL
jgi:phosphatidylserine decarboxylase